MSNLNCAFEALSIEESGYDSIKDKDDQVEDLKKAISVVNGHNVDSILFVFG